MNASVIYTIFVTPVIQLYVKGFMPCRIKYCQSEYRKEDHMIIGLNGGIDEHCN